MTVANTNDPGSPAGAGAWSEQLDEPVRRILGDHGSSYRAHDRVTAHFKAIPLGSGFNKTRTNLLLRLIHPTAAYAGSRAFVDDDLQYVAGTDPRLKAAMAGMVCEQNWKMLSTPRLSRSVTQALVEVLELVQSPLGKPVREAMGHPVRRGGDAGPAPLPPLLATLAREVWGHEAKAAHECCFRTELAAEVAIILTRPVDPCCPLIYSREHGVGCDHLALAAAYRLMECGVVLRTVRVSGAAVAAGFWHQSEAEGSLRKLLAEATHLARRNATLLIVQDLDFLLKGPVGRALLSRAIDDGLRFIAVLREASALDDLNEDGALARRLQPVEVRPPREQQLLESLRHLAARSGIAVAPAAIRVAAVLGRKHTSGNPAGALALLGAAIADAAWHGRREVLPDDVVGVHRAHFDRA